MNCLEAIVLLDEYYNHKKPMSENLIHLYADSLSDINPNILERIVMEWIKSGKPFMPKIAELTEAASRVHVDRFIDGRRVVREEKDYFVTEEFTENENGIFRVTYRALKPREFDTVIAQ